MCVFLPSCLRNPAYWLYLATQPLCRQHVLHKRISESSSKEEGPRASHHYNYEGRSVGRWKLKLPGRGDTLYTISIRLVTCRESLPHFSLDSTQSQSQSPGGYCFVSAYAGSPSGSSPPLPRLYYTYSECVCVSDRKRKRLTLRLVAKSSLYGLFLWFYYLRVVAPSPEISLSLA